MYGQLLTTVVFFNLTASKKAVVSVGLPRNDVYQREPDVFFMVSNVFTVFTLISGIQQDYQKILKAPWNQKFNILNEALGKVDQLVQNVDHSAGVFDKTIKEVIGVDLAIHDNLGELTNGVSGFIGNISHAVKKLADVKICQFGNVSGH